MTLPRPSQNNKSNYDNYNQHSAALDLSDVVGDFEATLKRLSKPKKESKLQPENFTGLYNEKKTYLLLLLFRS